MRCDLITSATRLQKAMKRVQESWLDANEQWNDPVSHKFQEKYLDPIVPQMQLTLAAIHELMQVLDDAVAETSDPGA
jgi:hypothetical protein